MHPGAAQPIAGQSGDGRRGPELEQLVYLKTLLELGLLLLAIPWLIVRLIRNPARALKDAGEHHLS